jgi:hypothetical protein
MNSKGGQKQAHGIGVILTAIVCLKGEDRKVELGLNVFDECTYGWKNVRLIAQRDCPEIVCVVIKENNIVFVAGMTVNRSSPNI